jgi:DNA-binding Xre family transcriptional regulator
MRLYCRDHFVCFSFRSEPSRVQDESEIIRMRRKALFAQALKRWRARSGLTQEGLAHEAGITTSYVSQVQGGRKVPTLTTILKLCRALECTPSELLSDFTTATLERLRFD